MPRNTELRIQDQNVRQCKLVKLHYANLFSLAYYKQSESPIYFFVCLFVCLFVRLFFFARFPDIGAMKSSPNNIKLNGGKVKRQTDSKTTYRNDIGKHARGQY